jgi:DNA-binding MarR family transcriptional regulator
LLVKELGSLLGSLTASLRRALVESAAEMGLSAGDAAALWILSGRDALPTRGLAERLEIDPANASTMVSRLERRGLVSRRLDAHDRRRRLVSLTGTGRETVMRLAESVAERRPAFRSLSTEELLTLRDLLTRIESDRRDRT